jgi:glutathione reductase (NADPH)
MPSYDFDLFAIGAGSGGVRATRMSAAYGARVAVAEERPLGGTCVNVGCIPKKLLVYASHFREEVEAAVKGYGWTVGPRRHDWATLIARKDDEIRRLNGVYARLLDDAGVERFDGHARVLDPHTVEVGGRRYSAEHLLVATGGWPVVPEIPGREHVITSNEAFHLKEMPRRVVIVGGGYIAVEFAGIFHGLGAEVSLLYRGPLFLRGFDEDLRTSLAEQMRRLGIDLRFETRVSGVERDDGELVARLEGAEALSADAVMYATGRAPLTRGIGLEQAGVELDDRGAVVVDRFSRSSVPSIWAIGDATDRVTLTPVALHEGMCLARTLFRGEPTAPDHENVASAVFSQPAIGTVGLTEAEARDRYGEVDVYRSHFRPLKHTLTGIDETTVMKLVVDRRSDRVIGVHMLGPEAGETIQGFAVALKSRATKAEFDATIGIHPTGAEEFVTMREKMS